MLKHHKPEKVRVFFNAHARLFDSIYGSRSNRNTLGRLADKWFRKSMYVRFQNTIRYVDSPDIQSVLDIGCGPGRYTREFLRLHKKVIGIDMASNMLQMAEQLCKTEFPSGDFTFFNSDYLNFQLDHKCDASVLIGFFDYIEDPKLIFRKLVRDTTKLILASFPKKNGLLAFQRRLRYRIRNCPLYLYSKNKVIDILHSSGLRDYQIDETDREYYLAVHLEKTLV